MGSNYRGFKNKIHQQHRNLFIKNQSLSRKDDPWCLWKVVRRESGTHDMLQKPKGRVTLPSSQHEYSDRRKRAKKRKQNYRPTFFSVCFALGSAFHVSGIKSLIFFPPLPRPPFFPFQYQLQSPAIKCSSFSLYLSFFFRGMSNVMAFITHDIVQAKRFWWCGLMQDEALSIDLNVLLFFGVSLHNRPFSLTNSLSIFRSPFSVVF